jgi:hypothetical protein
LELYSCGVVDSLAVGKLISEDDDASLFYLKHINILDVVFAPSVVLVELANLVVLTDEYLQMLNETFPSHTLKSKRHHLTHYPQVIKEVCPLTTVWCTIIESKHQCSKRMRQMSSCYKKCH